MRLIQEEAETAATNIEMTKESQVVYLYYSRTPLIRILVIWIGLDLQLNLSRILQN